MGELTVPKVAGYDPAVHISVSDIAVDCPTKPDCTSVEVFKN